MQSLSGHLWEMVVYKNRTTGGESSEKRSRHIFIMEDNLLHAMSKVGYV